MLLPFLSSLHMCAPPPPPPVSPIATCRSAHEATEHCTCTRFASGVTCAAPGARHHAQVLRPAQRHRRFPPSPSPLNFETANRKQFFDAAITDDYCASPTAGYRTGTITRTRRLLTQAQSTSPTSSIKRGDGHCTASLSSIPRHLSNRLLLTFVLLQLPAAAARLL